MQDPKIKEIKKIYADTLVKLKELRILQKKIIKEEFRKIEKAQIKKLQEELAK